MTTLTVALALAAVQIGAALLVLMSSDPSIVPSGILLVAGVMTFAGAMIGAARRGAVGPALVGAGQLVVCGLLALALWREWEDSRTLGVDGVVFGFLGVALVASAGVAFATLLAWSATPGRVGGLVLAGGLVLGGGGVTAAGAAATVSRIDCGRFQFDRGRWMAGGVEHTRLARTIAECGTLDGRTRAEARAMLGSVVRRPDDVDVAGSLEIAYDAAGRVSDVRKPDAAD